MATPAEKLAQSLDLLHELQQEGVVAIRSSALTRTHRERLVKAGFIKEVMKGWYIPSKPDEKEGDSSAWYTSYWDFCATYLSQRFDDNWCLSPEQSLLLHAGNWTVPRQLLVRSPKGGNGITTLPHGTSLFDTRYNMPSSKEMENKSGLWVYSIIPALITCTQKFFKQHPTEARAILSMQRDASAILAELLAGGHSIIAGRLAGAFRNIGKDVLAEHIIQTMRTAGYDVRETDPFDEQLPISFSASERSPYVNRMRIAWHEMRQPVIETFQAPPRRPSDADAYLEAVDEIYVTDAYHSLSIEGYRVNRELIERVRRGTWNPDNDESDRNGRNALAARGYWQAFQAVKKSISKVFTGEPLADVVEQDHHTWYRELFGPSITAGILSPKDLSGYRNDPVYIRRSMHVPPNCKAVRDLMPALFELLRTESESSVQVILGHFFFVFIHPYMDGNGRIARFLMNVVLASAGFPWTIVPVEQRNLYLQSLEKASVEQNIASFCKFISGLIK